MITKQITFEGNYSQEGIATEWLHNLSKCFKIRNAKLRSYLHKNNWSTKHRCQVEVTYE